jgi:NAD+ synthase (glutamine-hydrolysing)
MRMALAQMNPLIGDVTGNCRRIRAHLETIRGAGVHLVVFPELSITGYPPKDLLLKPRFISENLEAIHALAAETATGPSLLVGFVQRNASNVGRELRNALALLSGGRVVGEFYKSLLPTYDVFDEHRYFEPADLARTADLVCGDRTIRLGITICEDLWNDPATFHRPLYHRNPLEEVCAARAEVLINASASPFEVEKQAFRESLLGGQAASKKVPLAFVNQVGGNDELVFDGGSCVFDATGRIAARAKAFEEDILIVDLHIPPNEPTSQQPGAGILPGVNGRCEPYPEPVSSVYQALVLGTRDYLHKCGFAEAVLGLSGGIDSALTACIAADALGPKAVHGVAMPSRYSSDHSITDAQVLAENLGIDFRTIPIAEMHDVFEQYLSPFFQGRPPDITEENVQARIRGNILMALSNKFRWLLLTTGNKSELAVGYCTLYGDMCGGLAVISDVPKTMVYLLARHRNAIAGREIIPRSSIDKPPSAELRPNQCDQDTLPEYEILDAILHQYIELERSADEIIRLGFDEATVHRVARLVDLNEYKRKQAATGLKVTSRAFGVGRRMPIAARFS